MNSAQQILRDVFGYGEFRPGQEEVIATLTSGQSVLAVMPTGAGKSICYQIPAVMADRLTIVVSPLLALMDDQVAALRTNGVDVACIHSGHSREQNIVEWRRVKDGAKLLYLSPERLMTERMLAALSEIQPAMFVVDEAHCISKWGASFRPDYEHLSRLPDLFPESTVAAFTATADKATRNDIAEKLFRGNGRIVVHGFDRPNLRLTVANKAIWKSQLMRFLEDKTSQAGIVYCLSRKFTDEVAVYLSEQGLNAIPYHAGQTADQRKINQDRFMSEDAVVMVATIAFGMGIDKPDIRYVCHLNLPGSMEAYYQEIGRAGRDGAPAETLLLHSLRDMGMRRQFIANEGDEAHRRREHHRLDALLAYCEASECRRIALLAYFDEESGPCGNCDNCLSPPVVVDGTERAQTLLSTIRQTGQVFGAGHVIDILRGAESQKVLERRHQNLETFATGKQWPKDEWTVFVRQLVAAGFLSINIEKYGGLELSERGCALLAGCESFSYRQGSVTSSERKSVKKKIDQPVGPGDVSLLSQLKKLRLDLARARNVPAYVVFSDSTLIEMAGARPTTLDGMSDINGIGPKKLKEFGAIFLRAISEEGLQGAERGA
ncbi:MAG: DNA helicase RecQ [Rhodospirillaceae bacterium]|nr:DNA helicase RecQ [Rhodospirillaceae bacterium]